MKLGVALGATDDGVGFGVGVDDGVGAGVGLVVGVGVGLIVDDGDLDPVVVGDGGVEVEVAETTGLVGTVVSGAFDDVGGPDTEGAGGVDGFPGESVGATSAGLGGELGGKVACRSRFSTLVFS